MKNKVLSKPGLDRDFFNMIKGIYEEATANITLNDERLNDHRKFRDNKMSTLTTSIQPSIKYPSQCNKANK